MPSRKKRLSRARENRSSLVTDSDRRRRIAICLKVLEVYDRMSAQFGDPGWAGHTHPYIQRLGIHSFVIDWKLEIKEHVDEMRKNCEHLRSQLQIAEELDKEED